MTMNDQALLQAVRAGDREALGRLFDRHAPTALAVAMRWTHQRAMAESIVHDVFVDLWHMAPRSWSSDVDVARWLHMGVLRAVRRAGLAGTGSQPVAEPAFFGRPSPTDSPTPRRLLLIEPDADVANVLREVLADLGFEVSVLPTDRPWWPQVRPRDVVLVGMSGEASDSIADTIDRMRNAPETADALLVCGSWPSGDVPGADWLAAARIRVLRDPADARELGTLLRGDETRAVTPGDAPAGRDGSAQMAAMLRGARRGP